MILFRVYSVFFFLCCEWGAEQTAGGFEDGFLDSDFVPFWLSLHVLGSCGADELECTVAR